MTELDELRARLAAAVARREEAHTVYLVLAAQAKEIRQQIHAIEHPPRPRAERGLKPGDDLSFLAERQLYPREPVAKKAEMKRRQRIRDAIGDAMWQERREHKHEERWEFPTMAEFVAARDRHEIERLLRDFQ